MAQSPPPLSQLAFKIIQEKYLPTKEEYSELIKYKNKVNNQYAMGALVGLVSSIIITRKMKPLRRILAPIVSSLLLGSYFKNKNADSNLYDLMNIKNSALSGELIVIMQKDFPHHPAILKWMKENQNRVERRIGDETENDKIAFHPSVRIQRSSYDSEQDSGTPVHARNVTNLHRRFGIPVQREKNENSSNGSANADPFSANAGDDVLFDPWALLEVDKIENSDLKKKKEERRGKKMSIHERRLLNREKFLKWEEKGLLAQDNKLSF